MTSMGKSFAAIAVLLTAMLASAQHLDHAKVTVPFSFNAGRQNLPAGDYEISINDSNDVVLLSAQGIVRGMLLATRGQALADSRSYLRFRQQAGQWFLQDVAVSGVTEQFSVRRVSSEQLTQTITGQPVYAGQSLK